MKYKVRKELNNWLAENGFGDIKVYSNRDFEAQTSENLIGIANTYSVKGLEGFAELVQDLGLEKNVDIMTLYTLHELGHTQTYDEFEATDELKYMIKDFFITWTIKLFGDKVYDRMNRLYQRLPQEKRATEWAVDFINENENAVDKLESILARM